MPGSSTKALPDAAAMFYRMSASRLRSRCFAAGLVLMASILGAIVGVLMKLQGSLREGRFVPFGPFLAGGGLVVLLAGLGTVLDWIGWA